MQVIKLKIEKQSYNIIVGSNIIRFLGGYLSKMRIGDAAYIISNARIKNKYGRLLDNTLKRNGFKVKFRLIPDSERSKSIGMASSIIKDIAGYDQKKRIFIIAFGGGVVGDLAGFVASIYKRGIPYIQVPTTLLAQVDSAIGGKTAVDLIQGKNLVGAFYQPRLVFSDIHWLRTLSLRQLRSGLSEVIKYAVIKDRRLFIYLEKNYQNILNLKTSPLEFIVRRASSLKAGIVRLDEREEKGVRTILNFGHTIGHAIEAASQYKKYNHGEAIALGMLVACDLSKKLKTINLKVLQRIENLIRAVGLPTKIKNVSVPEIIKIHYRDKKFIGSRNRFVLIKDIGKTKIAQNLSLGILKNVLKKRT